MASSTATIASCVACLSRRTGIVFDQPEPVAALIVERIRALGLAGPAEYLALIQEQRGLRHELEELASRITTGETFFLRDREQLQALVACARALVADGRVHELQIWCAGCASGEEAYSLAILLEELRRTRHDFEFSLLATDLNPRALDKARRGHYAGRALRAVDEAMLARYFLPDGDGYLVGPELRARITFEYLNLVEELPADGRKFSFIICRNVFIYFTQATVQEVVRRFEARLEPWGLLFLGHSETLQFMPTGFKVLQLPGGFAYAPVGDALLPRAPRTQPLKLEPRPTRATRPLPPPDRPAGSRPKGTRPVPAAPAQPPLALAAAAGAAGDYERAREHCRQALRDNPLATEAYRMLYHIGVSRGELAPAVEAIRKLLYLDGDDLAARYHLARSLARLGDAAASRQEYRNLLAACEGRQPEAAVPDSDGMTVALLRRLCKAALNIT